MPRRDQSNGQLRRLIRLRRTDVLHWSQAQAAQATGMSKGNWRRIEDGGPSPAETLARMLYAVGAEPAEVESLDGGPAVARELQERLEMLPREGKPPGFITSEAEAHLWTLPVSEPVRRYLILCLRVALQAEADREDRVLAL